MANAFAPPRFRCTECRQIKPKTVFDEPEADGTYVCQDCERADLSWHIANNPHLDFASREWDRR